VNAKADDQRSGVSYRLVLALIAASLGVAFAGAVYVYLRYVRYVPRLDGHVPADFAVALRLDVEQAVVYEPFRQYLLPLIEVDRPQQARPGGELALGGRAGSRLEAFRSATTVELGVDLREVAIAVDTAGEWLVLLGGHFRRDGVVPGAFEVLEREGIPLELRAAPDRLVHPSGAAFAVAGDGVLVLAASEALLLRSLLRRPGPSRFRTGAALSVLVGQDEGSQLGGATLDVWPGQDFPLELHLPASQGLETSDDVEAVLSGKTGDFKLFEGTGPWRLTPQAGGSLRADTRLSRASFHAAVAELAESLGLLMGLRPAHLARTHPE
jgi:hypothetical protein